MTRRHRWQRIGLIAAAALTLGGAGTQVPGPKPKVAPPRPVAPKPMPTLPPAQIDDTLVIGGTDVEASKLKSRMTVAVRVDGRGPYRFVVDSGADVSVVGTQLADSLGLSAGEPVVLNGMTESAVVQRVRIDSLGLGQSELGRRQLPVLREADLGADGMIGIDSLSRQRVMLDFEKRTITLEDPERPPPHMVGEIVVTARRRRGQLILTQVKANGIALDAVVDTGSEVTIGNLALRDALIGRKRDKYLTTAEVSGVTGRPLQIEVGRVQELRLGAITFRDIPIAFADLPPFQVFGLSRQPALLLGTDLMENFRRVSLDFRTRKVRFQLRRCKDIGLTIAAGFASRLLAARDAQDVCRR